MTITPAHRVSQIIKKGGVTTVSPESHREGVKVVNIGGSASQSLARLGGQAVVTVRCDFDIANIGARRAKLVVEILTEAGYRAEINEGPGAGGNIINVWEPGWQLKMRRPADGEDVAPAVEERIAIRRTDGLVEVHVPGCPAIPVAGKRQPVTGSTVEEVAPQLEKLMEPKRQMVPFDPTARLTRKLIHVHECVTQG